MNAKRHALLIGNGQFQENSGFPNLKYTTNDINRLEAVLDSHYDSITSLVNLSRVDILSELQRKISSLNPDELLLIYYTGHGKLHDHKKLYLATAESTTSNLLNTALSYNTIQAVLKNRKHHNVVILLDCCYSGAVDINTQSLVNPNFNLDFQGNRGCLLTASAGHESAKESSEWQHGVFTYYLIQGLTSPDISQDNGGWISTQRLYEYTSKQLLKSPYHQTPMFKGHKDCCVPLFNNNQWIKQQIQRSSNTITTKSAAHDKKRASHPHLSFNKKPLISSIAASLFVTAIALPLLGAIENRKSNTSVEDIEKSEHHQIIRDHPRSDSVSPVLIVEKKTSNTSIKKFPETNLYTSLSQPCRYLWVDNLPLHTLISFDDYPQRDYVPGMCLHENKVSITIQAPGYEKKSLNVSLNKSNTRIKPTLTSLECHQLWLNELPNNSTVILPKIPEKYYPGICLPPQNLLVKIKTPGYRTYEKEVDLTQQDQNFAPILTRAETCHPLNIQGLPYTAKVTLPELDSAYEQGMCLQTKTVLLNITAPGFHDFHGRYSINKQSVPITIELRPKKEVPIGKMVLLEQDEFLMGCQHDEWGCDKDESPLHPVQLSHFYISATEVTFDQYDYYCDRSPECDRPDDEGWGRGSNPVINVSWVDVQRYISWLNNITGEAYRLPTEAEWEYAARSYSTTKFSWGNEHSQLHANSGWPDEFTKIAPVSSLSPNNFGLFDMHGNVWEWCQDWYGKDYYSKSSRKDPLGPLQGDKRILRGGSWKSWPKDIRSAGRHAEHPLKRSPRNGFRLAKTYHSTTSDNLSAATDPNLQNPW